MDSITPTKLITAFIKRYKITRQHEELLEKGTTPPWPGLKRKKKSITKIFGETLQELQNEEKTPHNSHLKENP